MTVTRTFGFCAVALLIYTEAARAGEWVTYDIAGPYLRRSDSISAGAGNSKEANTATHMLDPWPPYVGRRRIPGDGARMSGAVERYRDVRKIPESPAPLSHPAAGQMGAVGSSSSSSSSPTTTTTSTSTAR
jgi:hypothetical protein